ncbi:CapA family protein [Phormidium sp. LEGE 05292]|uniref:CapA family protein n=1 Tax=[Phormidium] sp. LEGE 05292 TaxID=767427 RepID=UPI00188036D4|nr:CapA family protein [Phormidium sp. LEGE 05292]MBE9225381.1 CapA family protein [Phormidium sp. LEGE 05292]
MKFTPSLLIFFLLVLISGCNQNQKTTAETLQLTQLETSPKPTPVKSYTKEAKLVAVGDLLMHMSLTRSGYIPEQKTYNFDGFFTEVKPIISSADWAIANVETTLAGAEMGYSGYPLFNAPPQLVDAAKKAGFNVLTTSNNHSLDKGEKGVINTINNIRFRGVVSTGTARTAKEAAQILMVKKNDINMAILAYTYGTNGIPIPQGKTYLVSLIDEGKIINDIARARKQGADLVTVSLHFGNEYQRQPDAAQKQLVESLIKAGADIILGSHPHVVQPYQVFRVKGKDGKLKTRAVIYSMGNFVGNQNGKYRNLGVIFAVKVRKTFPQKTVEIVQVEALPTAIDKYTLNNKLNFRVLPLSATLSRKEVPFLSPQERLVLKDQLFEMKSHVKSIGEYKTINTVK